MSGLPVDVDAIRALADILLETGLTEIEIAEGNSRIRVVRAPAVMQAAVAPAAQTNFGRPPADAEPVPDDADFSQHPGAVKSPMVGVAYLSPEPGAPSFVSVGQTVTAGQTVLLIEAMKTFNQIKAPRAGMLLRLMVASGQPVEYDQPLFVID